MPYTSKGENLTIKNSKNQTRTWVCSINLKRTCAKSNGFVRTHNAKSMCTSEYGQLGQIYIYIYLKLTEEEGTPTKAAHRKKYTKSSIYKVQQDVAIYSINIQGPWTWTDILFI
jgi:hypothetical protein